MGKLKSHLIEKQEQKVCIHEDKRELTFIALISGDPTMGGYGSEIRVTVSDPEFFISNDDEVKYDFQESMKEFLKKWCKSVDGDRVSVFTEKEYDDAVDDLILREEQNNEGY